MKKYKVSPATIIMYDNETGEEISRSENHMIGNIFGNYPKYKINLLFFQVWIYVGLPDYFKKPFGIDIVIV